MVFFLKMIFKDEIVKVAFSLAACLHAPESTVTHSAKHFPDKINACQKNNNNGALEIELEGDWVPSTPSQIGNHG